MDFFKNISKLGAKGRSSSPKEPTKSRVKDFNIDQLENAAAQMQSQPGVTDDFFSNLGSFFRPAGTLGAAIPDYVGGEGTTKKLIEGVMGISAEMKKPSLMRAALEGIQRLIPGPVSVTDFLDAPTGDSRNTTLGKALDGISELMNGVSPNEQDKYLTDQFKARVARATEGSGFNDVARSIAENRQGQSQDNLVERTLGRVPYVGAYFDRHTPSVEDRAIEAGATPEQAAFISFFGNPLEWINAESKAEAATKLEKAGAGALRKAVNRIGSPLVDPLQAGIDWALPGKVPTSAAVNAAPVEPGSIRQRFANNLGVNVDELPNEIVDANKMVGDAPASILDEVNNVAEDAPVTSAVEAPIAASEPAQDFFEAIASPVARDIPVSPIVDEVAEPVLEQTSHSIAQDALATIRQQQSEDPVFAAARAALNDPNAGDVVDQLDEMEPTFALEAPKGQRVNYGMPIAGGFPLPTGQQLNAFSQDLGALKNQVLESTKELRASLSRWFSSTTLGKVDAATVKHVRDGADAQSALSRAMADTYNKALNGDIAGIIGSSSAGRYAYTPDQKALVQSFIDGTARGGEHVDEAMLKAAGLPDDAIEVSKLVRGYATDYAADALMAETQNLPLEWFTRLNDEDRAIVGGLAQTASRPKVRQAFEKTVSPAKLSFLDEARAKVDAGFQELNDAGHWLDGENPTDMLLSWGPYLANRGEYTARLYRLFEHGVLDKGPDATKAYIDTLRAKGAVVTPDEEAFLYTHWMNGGKVGGASASELDRIKKRNPNMSKEIKDILQEIEDPAYAHTKAIFQINRMRNNLKMRRWMAGQERFVSRPGETAVEFAKRNGYNYNEITELGTNVGASPQRFGAMHGRFIHNDLWDLAFQVHALPGLQNGNDMAMQFNKAILQRWKFWHTVANPASHIRQGVQNAFSVFIAGGYKAITNLPAAINDYKGRGNLYALARKHGLLGNKSLHDIAEKIDDSMWKHLDFNAAESFVARFGRFGESVAKASEAFRVGGGKMAADWWQYIDEIFRMSLLKAYMDKGWDIDRAVRNVEGSVYGGVKISRADQLVAGVPPSSTFATLGPRNGLRATGIRAADWAVNFVNVPFWGASRFILEQSVRSLAGMEPGSWRPLSDPGRMARSMALMGISYGLFKQWQNAEGLESAKEVEQRPDYQRPYLPMMARIPNSVMELIDDKGKVGYIDWSWALPWGDLASQGFNPKTGKMEWRGGSKQLVQISPLIKPFFETMFNKDLFRDEIGARSEIYNPMDPAATRLRKSTAHVWRAWLPPWAVNPVGGLVDAVNADAGPDGHVDAKEAMRAFMQGIANDSGHTSSKLASGIYNSFDYWWSQKFPDGQERLQVSDYMGREQYLVKSIADALAIKITSTDMKQIEKRRKTARTSAIQNLRHYYTQLRSQSTNPQRLKALRDEEAKYIKEISMGKPVPQWYDERPEDTWMNVRRFFAEKLRI